MRYAAVFFLGFSLAASGAEAQSPSGKSATPDPKPLASNYELTNAPGDKKCAITLDTKTAGPGFALVYDRTQCTALFGFLPETAAWLPGVAGAIRFVNAAKKTVAEFTEGVGGQYEALREGDGVYFLANLQFVAPADVATAAEVTGDWNIARPNGAPICGITLTNQPAGDEIYNLTLKPNCDAAIAKFAPTKWYMDRGDIVLLSDKDERMRFGKQVDGGWAKVPDIPRALLLTKP